MALACPAFVAEAAPGLCRTFDAYCERTSAALDAEPLNAATNVLMFVAAWGALRIRRRHPNPDVHGLVTAMIAAIVAGGIGAFLFHTTAAAWAAIVDMAPFLVFMLLVLWVTLTRLFRWPAAAAVAGLAAFLATALGAGRLLPGGVAYYLVPLAVLALVAAILVVRRSPAGPSYVAAAVVFAAAVAARQLDGPLCGAMPFGTHFLWHSLAALLAFILIRAAVLYAPPRPR